MKWLSVAAGGRVRRKNPHKYATHARAALAATVTTTIPAIIVGVLLYWAGL